jgi:hypothetical protein
MSQQSTLDPEAQPFLPQPPYTLPGCEEMQLAMTVSWEEEGHDSTQPNYIPPSRVLAWPFTRPISASQSINSQGDLLQSTTSQNHHSYSSHQKNDQVMMQSIVFSAPDSNTIIGRPIATPPASPRTFSTRVTECAPESGPRGRSCTRRPLPSPPISPSTQSADSSALSGSRIPLPDLPPPSTPSLGSTPQFESRSRGGTPLLTPSSTPLRYQSRLGDRYSRSKSRRSRSPLPVTTRKAKKLVQFKLANPFIDLLFTDGNAPHQPPIGTGNVGPYRKAAVWEFVGQTFDKGGRTVGKRRSRRRFAHYVAGYIPSPGPSKLSYEESVESEEYKRVQKVIYNDLLVVTGKV